MNAPFGDLTGLGMEGFRATKDNKKWLVKLLIISPEITLTERRRQKLIFYNFNGDEKLQKQLKENNTKSK